MQDFRITSTLDDTYRDGIFRLQMELKNHRPNPADLRVSYELLDAKGNTVHRKKSR